MAEVPGLKQLVFSEDVETGASASEATMTKIAGTLNHVAEKQFLYCAFNLHGSYWITGVPDPNVDIEFLVPCDCEIVKIQMYHKDAGASGTCEMDVLRFPLAGGSASIFSTRPAIPSTAGANARILTDYSTGTPNDLSLPAGSTAPRLAISQLDENDVLKVSFIQKQASSAEGVGVHIILRPI